MSILPISDAALAQEAADFAGRITPCHARWDYCFGRVAFYYQSKRGEILTFHTRTLPVCDRILGVPKGTAALKLAGLRDYGFAGAEARAAKWAWHKGPYFTVGPMEAWHVGHVYFARLVTHPHVVKVGFSRRVRERVDDIEAKCKSRIRVEPAELSVGTLADEQWWHREWRANRITGEWFFDPASTARTLPEFLAPKPAMEAA